jgi:hypothetical protein
MLLHTNKATEDCIQFLNEVPKKGCVLYINVIDWLIDV